MSMKTQTPIPTTTLLDRTRTRASVATSRTGLLIAWMRRPLTQRLLLLLALAAILLSLGRWMLSSSHTTFARTTSFETCETALPQNKPSLCNGADPIQGGCSADAETLKQAPVMLGNQIVGLAEIRNSPSCHTFWGRGFSYVPHTSVSVYVVALGTSSNASFLSTTPEAYSNMVYGVPSQITVSVILSATQIASVTVSALIPGV